MVGENMRRSFKLVALILSVALFAAPLLTLANCNPKLTKSGHCRGEDCPMMTQSRQTPTTQISQAPSRDSSCCRIASLPANKVKPAAIPEKLSVEPLMAQMVGEAVASAFAPEESPSAPVMMSSSSLQAVLCMFLV